MTEVRPTDRSDARGDGVTLRLLLAAVAGGRGTSSVQALAPEFPFEVARRGYAVGSAVLAAVLPANQGPTAAAPVAMDDTGLELADGIEASRVILSQLAQALEVIREHGKPEIIRLDAEWAVQCRTPSRPGPPLRPGPGHSSGSTPILTSAPRPDSTRGSEDQDHRPRLHGGRGPPGPGLLPTIRR